MVTGWNISFADGLTIGLSPIRLVDMKTPHWDLNRVKTLAAAPGGLFVQDTKASANFSSLVEAIVVVKATIGELTVRQFADTQTLTWDIADVYGVKMADGKGWYLKITIDETVPEVAVISFHPLLFPLKTNGGVVKP